MNDSRELLRRTAELAADYVESLGERPVFPQVTPEQLREALGGPLPEEPLPPEQVVEELVAGAQPGVVALGSGRYFGFVIGGELPAALAADWLTSTWDQNAGLYVGGPSASVVEQVAREWLVDLLGLPSESSVGFVTGTQMAHVTGLAAARWHVLDAVGWDVGANGLTGAPPVTVIAGGKRHVTVDRALRLLGLGAPTVVEADSQGRLVPEALREALGEGPSIVCAQVGEVNTGAFDPLPDVADACEASGAWLHVDGAFGIWAAVSPRLRHLVGGLERADSWTTDAHKWLNVPYDSGIVIVRHAAAHRAAMSQSAAYLIAAHGEQRDGTDWVPEASRRARVAPVHAVLRTLGRKGLAELVERCCSLAMRMAERLSGTPGVTVLNDVVLNQVLVRFSAPAVSSGNITERVIAGVQAAGVCWCGGTVWAGEPAMRISVSNWRTREIDIDRSAASILEAHARASA
ncbi:MAG TPA: aminotransferase class V-fold PLP-dependent enzyme [Gaiellaceae bacterium]|nr:aminotransferase class V-fold PLP-dependent enzyme [Gaiellaceae bacterium]